MTQIVEHLMALALPAGLRGRPDRAQVDPLHTARTCYGHLAGRLGVVLAEGLCTRKLIRLEDQDYRVTRLGERWSADFDLDLEALKKRQRMFARRCIDWSERVPHLGGALGDALAARLFELEWIRRAAGDGGSRFK